MDVRIDEIVTDLVVTEPVGPLSKEDTRNLIQTILQHIRAEQQSARQRQKDTGGRDRADQPEGEPNGE
jgi:hypothetical protein